MPRLPVMLKTGASPTLARLLRFVFRLDGGTATMCVRAAVKTAVEKEQSRELEACTGAFRCDRSDMREKKFPSHPLVLCAVRVCAHPFPLQTPLATIGGGPSLPRQTRLDLTP